MAKSSNSGRRSVVDDLDGGLALMVTHTSSGQEHSLQNGRPVPRALAAEMQADLFVKPSEDGLFPGHSQTWRKTR
jgi:hypothetical protein